MHSLGCRRSCLVERRGKGGTPRSINQGWWMEEVANAVGGGGEAGSMEDDRRHL